MLYFDLLRIGQQYGVARVLSHTAIVAYDGSAGLGAEQLGGNIFMTSTHDRNTMRYTWYRILALSSFQGHHFVIFGATRDSVVVRVERAKEALALVAEMQSFDNLVTVIAVPGFAMKILKHQYAVLEIVCGGHVRSYHAAKWACDRGSTFRTLKSLFCTTLADRVQASLQHLRNM